MLKGLPQIEHWHEWIDNGSSEKEWTFAALAQRRWELPYSATVFMIVTCDPMVRWSAKTEAYRALDLALEKLEHRLEGYYGRHWHRQFSDAAAVGELPPWWGRASGDIRQQHQ